MLEHTDTYIEDNIDEKFKREENIEENVMKTFYKTNPSIPNLDLYDELFLSVDKGAVAVTYLMCGFGLFIIGFVLYLFLYSS